MDEDLTSHEVSSRTAKSADGMEVHIQASVRDGKLTLEFMSDKGTWECEMVPEQAWLFASDIIQGAMDLDPGYIEDLIRASIEKFQAGDY